jgi:2',3'-cyclic-nucleotide 2'-phosphodiesterase/3'-nucleotidase
MCCKTYDVESIDSKVIDLNEYEEDQELLDLTFYDRKAVAYWSQEIVISLSNAR